MAHERVTRFLKQAKIEDKLEEVFGYGTTANDLNICKHTLDTCGCAREFMWSRKAPADDVREVPVASPQICEHHSNIGDMATLHEVLVTESRHRQQVRVEILKALPPKFKRTVKDPDGNDRDEFLVEPSLRYDDDREIVVDFVGDVTAQAQVKAHLDRQFPARRVKVPAAARR